MGTCRYCGQNAGWFRSAHPTCEEKHATGWDQMVAVATHAAQTAQSFDGLRGQLAEIRRSSFRAESDIDKALLQGWEKALDHFLNDGLLAADEEERLISYANRSGLAESTLKSSAAYNRGAQAAVLRDLMEGKLPTRVSFAGVIPFNLQKSEALVWLFNDVRYLEERIRRSYVGSSSGVSIRIAKGVYYRVGSFKGHPVETTQTELIDSGILGITTKHLYFAGARKSLRIPYTKVVSFTPFSDGIGIHRDAATAKPQAFITGDGWFIYNLVMNLSRRS